MSEPQAISPGISPIPLQLPGSEGLPPLGDSQPKKKRKQVVSARTAAINKNKTKAYDLGKMLINADIISGFDDAAGLQRFLDKAAQLESNFVTVSDASNFEEKKLLAECKAKYDQLTMIAERTEEDQQKKYAAWKKEIELEKEGIRIQKMHYLEMKSKNDDDLGR